ncbi:EboA domain-containing protein [Ferruginibacter paludis]|uniref:EboA domain-containing protein n=1 Tax=Ferruginibacter paludis TaxID=1310417 RepID=UPI0025B57622|nr:EboA domain-containing protein [Ferruginibacter paludis]MDN3654022.1 EboA domain-containing protein [Ferruginibacter paludis]
MNITVKNEIYLYDVDELKIVLSTLIKNYLTIDNYLWLEEKASLVALENNAAQLNLSFAAISRKTGREIIKLNTDQKKQVNAILPGFSIVGWPLHRLCRTWILLHVNAVEKDSYINKIDGLFKNAEMNELADLYAALPVFAYPEKWVKRCAEGIRSNIGIVLEAIMYDNPYPSKFLDEAAWNQLVLKAFFTEKDVNRIDGLDERANLSLASTLIDYAHERWAAKRPVNIQLWRLVGGFIDETNISDIQKIAASEDIGERKAAALTCFQSEYAPAKNLLENVPELKNEILANKLNWININA